MTSPRWSLRSLALLGLGAGALAAMSGAALVHALREDFGQARDLHGTEYVGSAACRRCHPAHYASFRRTFHRSMTQEAGPSSVLGRFDGRSLDYFGVRARMERDADGGYAIAFSSAGGEQRWRARIERCVGSHRYQQYLTRVGGQYWRLPIAWDVAAARFIHMNGAFLTPDPEPDAVSGRIARADYDRHVTRWNDNCVFCHNVHPNPGYDPSTGRFATQVAELGVACEACHGPGAEHIARNTNPVRRYALHASARADPTIRNPARMSAARSSEVCGRCHGQRITPDIARFEQHGDPFIPGEALGRYSTPLARDTRQNGEAGLFAPRFWADGTPRLTAYEFQAMRTSACARRGELSCESCHAMHAGDPNGQIRPGRAGDAACTVCHTDLAAPLAAAKHSRHPLAPSPSCRDCHMPDIVYGLVDARLSHHIERPDPAAQAQQRRPDACTLCHIDRTRSWAAQAANGRSLAGDEAAALGLSEVSYRLLAGDPIERAVAAHALGKRSARCASNFEPERLALLLDSLRDDPYPAVRSIAQRSLAALLPPSEQAARPLLAQYVPTDDAAQRAALIARLQAALHAPTLPLSAALLRSLRARAAQAAIEIGE